MPAKTTIRGTERCRNLLRKLVETHGPISLHVSANYGMTVVCLPADALSLGARDVLMGSIDGIPLYMMSSEIELWIGSTLILDVARGPGAGFSLEGPSGVHFTLRKRAQPAKRVWDANAILAAGPPLTHHSGVKNDD